MRAVVIAGTTIILLAHASAQPPDSKSGPMTVCQVISQRDTYRDLHVEIRGRLKSTSEGSYLEGEGCQDLVTDGFKWATSAIALGYGTPGKPPKIEPSDLVKLQSAGPNDVLYVTVVGLFETRIHFEMVTRGDGKTVPNGYGHLNASPAQLRYQEMKDVTVMRAKR